MESGLSWNPPHDRLNAAMLDRMFAATRLAPGARVLDPGCGDATHTIAIARRGYDCTGVDISETILESARANISAAGQSDLARVPMGLGFWDVHRFPEGVIRNTVIRFNSLWFRLRLPARWSSGNILIARKRA